MRRRQRAEDGIHTEAEGRRAGGQAIWVAVDKYLPTLEKGIVNLNPFCVPPARAAHTHTHKYTQTRVWVNASTRVHIYIYI